MILGAAYTLWMYKRVVFGSITNSVVESLSDLTGREALILWLLAIAVLMLGLWPAPLLEMMNPTIEQLVEQISVSKIK